MRVLKILLILGISVAITSAALSMGKAPARRSIAGAEGGAATGLIMDLRKPVIFVDANGDGNVESLKDAESGEIIYTFPSPIAKPQTGFVEISGALTISGKSVSLPPRALVLVD